MDHLVLPDPHASPDTDMERFKWLGQFILDRRPKKIVCLGDFADLPSLCSYDKGTRGFEGRRYQKDVAAVHEAQRLMWAPIVAHNQKQARNKKKGYFPSRFMLLGNHEHRINRAIECDAAMLEGTIDMADLRYRQFGWDVVPFKDVINIDGIAYSHYHISGVMGQAIGGIHPAANLLNKHLTSCTAGHAHIVDYSVKTNAFGKKLHGLVAGVFDNNHHDYAGKANDLWWRGLVMKHEVVDGTYEPEFISMARLEKMYG